MLWKKGKRFKKGEHARDEMVKDAIGLIIFWMVKR